MLLSFSVSNYRSIRDEATISLVALRRIKELEENTFTLPGNQKINLLKTLVVYGANASGKSNVLGIFFDLTFLLTTGNIRYGEETYDTKFDPFLVDSSKLDLPTKFSIQFQIINPSVQPDPITYDYSLSFTANQVVEEHLYFIPKGQKAKLFSRVGKDVSFGEYFRGPSQTLKGFVAQSSNQSKILLWLLFELGLSDYVSVEKFFNEDIIQLGPFNYGGKFDINNSLFAIHTLKEDKDRKLFNKFKNLLKALDTSIVDISIEKDENDPSFSDSSHKSSLGYHLATWHKSSSSEELIKFRFDRESQGTQSLISIGWIILDYLIKGRVVIVDEIDRSLHPKIVEYIFKIFNDPMINTNNAQLIATTHNAMIMRNDLFRRDQIVIAERGDDGASTYYNLAEIQGLRAGVPFERYYYAGMLGGTPDINDVDFRAEFL
jgi:uncharacterized protein